MSDEVNAIRQRDIETNSEYYNKLWKTSMYNFYHNSQKIKKITQGIVPITLP